jgi:hypothetical protein
MKRTSFRDSMTDQSVKSAQFERSRSLLESQEPGTSHAPPPVNPDLCDCSILCSVNANPDRSSERAPHSAEQQQSMHACRTYRILGRHQRCRIGPKLVLAKLVYLPISLRSLTNYVLSVAAERPTSLQSSRARWQCLVMLQISLSFRGDLTHETCHSTAR